jgi:hypothetical protein
MTLDDYWARRTPREVARDAISFAVHDAASAELGETRMEDDAEQHAREKNDPDHKRRHALRCVDVAHELGLDLDGWVANARATGSTWQELGDVIGSTRQNTHRRFNRADPTAQYLRSSLSSVGATSAPDDGWDDPSDPGRPPFEDAVPSAWPRAKGAWTISAAPGIDDETMARLEAADEDDRQARLDEQQWREEHDR